MTTEDIKGLIQHILASNTYYSKGYGIAFKAGGMVVTKVNEDYTVVFPNDYDGNYFYIRHDGDIRFNEDRRLATGNCGVNRTGFIDTEPAILVAVVQKADEYTVLNNLRNAMLSYSALDVVPTGAQLVAETVIEEEIDEPEEALARLKGQCIIKVRLNISNIYVGSDCILDPCKC